MASWYCTGCGCAASAIIPTIDPRYPLVACIYCKGKRPAVASEASARAAAALAQAEKGRKAAARRG